MIPHITLNNLGKKFNKEWIFRGVNHQLTPNQKLLIQGGNGSGKSTLLQVISGFVIPNEGSVVFSEGDKPLNPDHVKNYVSFASPYLQLVEDFTLLEMAEHVQTFKPFVNKLSPKEVLELVQLAPSRDKPIKQFSSGMKQRLKLGLAILADTPVLMLDEPVSNLDKNAIAWYKEMISTYTQNRSVIVCSNAISDEHFFCETQLNVMDYKLKQ